ncbi:sensor histidine kinase [Duganella sp. LjRoot269]|jgi:two-component system sensor histidine kinase TctE|uniref:sensor histidine kinase n=1 Tax=Duganella sp. LjRoot269 TaxID=3342305 RepID=UPI003ECE7050
MRQALRRLLPAHSLRRYLLLGILGPLALYIVFGSISLYYNALNAVNSAYDRMLVTTAYSVGDQIRVEQQQMHVSVSFATLEVYEAGFSTRMMYKVSDLRGRVIAGDLDLPSYAPGAQGRPGPHPAPTLLKVYEGMYGTAPVRIAAIFQPVNSGLPNDGAVIQIAEPLSFRESAVQAILWGTVWRQLLLLAFVAGLTMLVVMRALRPLESLRLQLEQRREEDLSPLSAPRAPFELQSVVAALNQLMGRLRNLLEVQQKFVANASHQLRTPLAVLKVQLQSGLRGDAPAEVIIREMVGTVERATNLANQLLSLAKVGQMRGRGGHESCNLAAVAREVTVALSPLISDKGLNFELDAAEELRVDANRWMLGELLSNLLDNAIRHTPSGGALGIRIGTDAGRTMVCVWDSGPGLAEGADVHRFEPFGSSQASSGFGLGLAICAEIAEVFGAALTLSNRMAGGGTVGLNANVVFTSDAGSAPP